MENNTASDASTRRTHFQSIEDFLREQDGLDAARLATTQPSSPLTQSHTPPTKKARRLIDVDSLAVEASAVREIGDINWVGRLLEYRAVNPPADGLKYIDAVIGTAPSRYNCIAVLTESPKSFGDTISFSRKKDAKQFASKKAIDWLIENNFMPKVGVKFPVPKTPVNQVAAKTKVANLMEVNSPIVTVKEISLQSPALTPKPSTSFASQIPELCTRLGFTVPRYEITKVSEHAPLYSGYAHFSGDPRVSGKIGEVESIYGQKNAKEMIAETLYAFLKDIEKQRMATMEKSDNDVVSV